MESTFNTDNRFFSRSEFKENYVKEIGSATDVYNRRKAHGIVDFLLSTYDFTYVSDQRQKLEALSKYLVSNFNYAISEISEDRDVWVLNGTGIAFPVDQDNLVYWVLNLYVKGYEFDCLLDGYGALEDSNEQQFLDVTPDLHDHYFDLAMESYNNGDIGMGIIHFSTAIRANPNDPNCWYSRAALKDELYAKKAARDDYDQAIKLAPDFADAILNRAANKDEAGEYDSAIADYTEVIALEPKNEMAYFNRGNSKFNKMDKAGAREDWEIAKQLGASYAQKRINEL